VVVRLCIDLPELQGDIAVGIQLAVSLLLVQVGETLPCGPVAFFDARCGEVGLFRFIVPVELV